MILVSLSTTAAHEIHAVVRSVRGQEIETTFTVVPGGPHGVAVANPAVDIFRGEDMTAADIRRIVAAVVAFDVAAWPGPVPDLSRDDRTQPRSNLP
ncbi:hypothetical protein [Cellulomonas terrae]|uniref:Uncharacterized protein n=1 Tax=Cellulomonas terrae TaxID=311234 RepID=A0A511JJL3_9CELL|nr:hypothetical protein [Cellulomonas terrae]GEL98200.1 hypothetical protein CTE05_17470 [Cellulomonas terrae]